MSPCLRLPIRRTIVRWHRHHLRNPIANSQRRQKSKANDRQPTRHNDATTKRILVKRASGERRQPDYVRTLGTLYLCVRNEVASRTGNAATVLAGKLRSGSIRPIWTAVAATVLTKSQLMDDGMDKLEKQTCRKGRLANTKKGQSYLIEGSERAKKGRKGFIKACVWLLNFVLARIPPFTPPFCNSYQQVKQAPPASQQASKSITQDVWSQRYRHLR